MCSVTQTCPILCDSVDCSSPGFSVHRIFQASILEWAVISFSRGSSRPVDQTHVSYVSYIGRQVLYHECYLKYCHFSKYFFWSFLWHCSGKSFCYFNHSLFLTKNGFTRLTPPLPDLTLTGSSSVIKKQVYSQRINTPRP